jgi:hypothetical protein
MLRRAARAHAPDLRQVQDSDYGQGGSQVGGNVQEGVREQEEKQGG